jgi:hypothetical protein
MTETKASAVNTKDVVSEDEEESGEESEGVEEGSEVPDPFPLDLTIGWCGTCHDKGPINEPCKNCKVEKEVYTSLYGLCPKCGGVGTENKSCCTGHFFVRYSPPKGYTEYRKMLKTSGQQESTYKYGSESEEEEEGDEEMDEEWSPVVPIDWSRGKCTNRKCGVIGGRDQKCTECMKPNATYKPWIGECDYCNEPGLVGTRCPNEGCGGDVYAGNKPERYRHHESNLSEVTD